VREIDGRAAIWTTAFDARLAPITADPTNGIISPMRSFVGAAYRTQAPASLEQACPAQRGLPTCQGTAFRPSSSTLAMLSFVSLLNSCNSGSPNPNWFPTAIIAFR
jgi:hypothetical protein